MTNIYILSKSYHDFVFCSLFIGRQKEKQCGCYVHVHKYTHKNVLTLKTT